MFILLEASQSLTPFIAHVNSLYNAVMNNALPGQIENSIGKLKDIKLMTEIGAFRTERKSLSGRRIPIRGKANFIAVLGSQSHFSP